MATPPRTDKPAEERPGEGHGREAGNQPQESRPAETGRHEEQRWDQGQSGGPNRPPEGRRPEGMGGNAPPPYRPPSRPGPPSRDQQIRTWLSHPLLLLIIGAIMTGVIVPTITGRWQRNQTAQDMKTQVINDATSAISIPMTQLSVTQNPVFSGGGKQPQFNGSSAASTYAAFLTKSNSVDSEIKAYFPENKIPIHWENLVGLLQNYYLLTYTGNNNLKKQYLQSIEHYFQVHHDAGGINWNLLTTGSWQTHGYYRAWLALGKKIDTVKALVLNGIMDAPAPSF